jgi:hypothetical protein
VLTDELLSYVTETKMVPPTVWLDEYHDDQKRPFAIFEFRYRTRGETPSMAQLLFRSSTIDSYRK